MKSPKKYMPLLQEVTKKLNSTFNLSNTPIKVKIVLCVLAITMAILIKIIQRLLF